MRNIFNILAIISAIIMIACILIQNRGASLGAAFGGESEFYGDRRGAEKVIFYITIITAVIFVLSIILSILSVR